MLPVEYPTGLKFIRTEEDTEEKESRLVFYFELVSGEALEGVSISGAIRISLEAGLLPRRSRRPAIPNAEVWLQLHARFLELAQFARDCAYPKPQNPREQE